MSDRVVHFDENTRIPLRLVWIVGGAMGGGVIWLTTMFIYLSFARTDIAEAKVQIRGIQENQVEKRDELIEALNKLDKKITAIQVRLQIKDEGEE